MQVNSFSSFGLAVLRNMNIHPVKLKIGENICIMKCTPKSSYILTHKINDTNLVIIEIKRYLNQ